MPVTDPGAIGSGALYDCLLVKRVPTSPYLEKNVLIQLFWSVYLVRQVQVAW